MPFCLSYIVASDHANEDALWVTEVWEGNENHDRALNLPAVGSAIPRGQALLVNFERIATTTPVWEVGIPNNFRS